MMARKVFVSSDMAHDERLIDVAESSPEAALIWPWLVTYFDDWGRAEAQPKRIKAQLFPMNNLVTVDLIAHALRIYHDVGLVRIYEVDGKQYMAIEPEKWWKYQTHIHRSKRDTDNSRYPAPDQTDAHEPPRDSAKHREEAREIIPSPSPSPSPTKRHAHCASVSDGYTEEFEHFWTAYPRKKDKKRAFRAWKARLKDRDAPATDQLILAAQNYAAECEAQGTAERFIKHGSTFLGPDKPYEEYLEARASPDNAPPEFTPEEMAEFETWLAEERARDGEEVPWQAH